MNEKLPIEIGHHCWIGTGVTVLQRMEIVDGAIAVAGNLGHISV